MLQPNVQTSAVLALLTVATMGARPVLAAPDKFADVRQEIAARHEESVTRLQAWIALPSIAAENRNSAEGADRMAQLARDAGFQRVTVVPSEGKPGVFATLDAGAKKTVGLYFMYDVKQFDPAEWTSPPLEARLVEKPGLGKAIVGRGAVNQKGPEAAFLAALHAIRGAGRKFFAHGIAAQDFEIKIRDIFLGFIAKLIRDDTRARSG